MSAVARRRGAEEQAFESLARIDALLWSADVDSSGFAESSVTFVSIGRASIMQGGGLVRLKAPYKSRKKVGRRFLTLYRKGGCAIRLSNTQTAKMVIPPALLREGLFVAAKVSPPYQPTGAIPANSFHDHLEPAREHNGFVHLGPRTSARQ